MKIINKKSVPYDIGGLWFDTLLPLLMIILFVVAISLGFNFAFALIILVVSIWLYRYLVHDRYGSWIINYNIIGEITLSVENIHIVKHELNDQFELDKSVSIRTELDYYQNRTFNRSKVSSGIGRIEIYRKGKK